MANTFNLGNGSWAQKTEKLLAYNAENDNYKPLPFDFDRASTATRVNKQGLIETVGVDEPRIDFLNNSKGHLLLELQRQNVVTYSEDLTEWTTTSLSVTSNNVLSPDGTQNADKVTATADFARIQYTYTLSASTTYNISFYVKNIDAVNPRVQVYDNDNSTSLLNTYYGSELTGEWKRLTYSFTTTTGTSILVRPIRDINDTEEMYLWGIQVEAGSYATSYIPTQGSAVTRIAESCSQTPPDGVIGQTEGTVFLDSKMALQSINNYQLFSINNGGGSDRIRILTATGNRLRFIYQLDGGTTFYSFYNPTDYGSLTNLKIAFTYKSGDIKVYINGVLADSSTNTFTIAEKLIDIDIATSSGGYNQMLFNDIKLYNEALTDQELQALTS